MIFSLNLQDKNFKIKKNTHLVNKAKTEIDRLN